MSPPAAHFVRVGAEVRGPLRVEQLREMATIEVVTAESEVATSAAGPWARLGSVALWEAVKPVPPEFGFKANEFKPVNTDATPAMDPSEEIRRAEHPAPSLRGREVVVPLLGRRTRDEPLNEVQRMVLDVNQRVEAHAPPQILPLLPSKFRPLRWLLPLSFAGSSLIFSLPLWYGRSYDRASVKILVAWLILYHTGLIAVVLLERRQRELFRAQRVRLEQRE